jgi:hypothetical protein
MDEGDFRDFIREQTLRHERASRQTERGLRALERRTDEMVRRTDIQVEALRDLIQDSRAQRRALLAVLDRLPPPAAA